MIKIQDISKTKVAGIFLLIFVVVIFGAGIKSGLRTSIALLKSVKSDSAKPVGLSLVEAQSQTASLGSKESQLFQTLLGESDHLASQDPLTDNQHNHNSHISNGRFYSFQLSDLFGFVKLFDDLRFAGKSAAKNEFEVSVTSCSENLCLGGDNCDLCQSSLVNTSGVHVLLGINQGDQDLSWTLRDQTNESDIIINKLTKMNETVYYLSEIESPRFDRPFVWRLSNAEYYQDLEFDLSLKELVSYDCLQRKTAEFGLCYNLAEFGTFYGHRRYEFRNVGHCAVSLGDQRLQLRLSLLSYFEDRCKPGWTDKVDTFVEKGLKQKSKKWQKFFVFDRGDDGYKKFVLLHPSDLENRASKSFFLFLFQELGFDQDSETKEVKFEQLKKSTVDGSFRLKAIRNKELTNYNEIISQTRWDKVKKVDPEVIKSESQGSDSWTKVLSFYSRQDISDVFKKLSVDGETCDKDADCTSLCCGEGICRPHDPDNKIYCAKAVGESCVGSEFCGIGKHDYYDYVKKVFRGSGKYPIELEEFNKLPPCRRSRKNQLQCVDHKCYQPKRDEYPFPQENCNWLPDPTAESLTACTKKNQAIQAEMSKDPVNCEF